MPEEPKTTPATETPTTETPATPPSTETPATETPVETKPTTVTEEDFITPEEKAAVDEAKEKAGKDTKKGKEAKATPTPAPTPQTGEIKVGGITYKNQEEFLKAHTELLSKFGETAKDASELRRKLVEAGITATREKSPIDDLMPKIDVAKYVDSENNIRFAEFVNDLNRAWYDTVQKLMQGSIKGYDTARSNMETAAKQVSEMEQQVPRLKDDPQFRENVGMLILASETMVKQGLRKDKMSLQEAVERILKSEAKGTPAAPPATPGYQAPKGGESELPGTPSEEDESAKVADDIVEASKRSPFSHL